MEGRLCPPEYIDRSGATLNFQFSTFNFQLSNADVRYDKTYAVSGQTQINDCYTFKATPHDSVRYLVVRIAGHSPWVMRRCLNKND